MVVILRPSVQLSGPIVFFVILGYLEHFGRFCVILEAFAVILCLLDHLGFLGHYGPFWALRAITSLLGCNGPLLRLLCLWVIFMGHNGADKVFEV